MKFKTIEYIRQNYLRVRLAAECWTMAQGLRKRAADRRTVAQQFVMQFCAIGERTIIWCNICAKNVYFRLNINLTAELGHHEALPMGLALMSARASVDSWTPSQRRAAFNFSICEHIDIPLQLGASLNGTPAESTGTLCLQPKFHSGTSTLCRSSPSSIINISIMET